MKKRNLRLLKSALVAAVGFVPFCMFGQTQISDQAGLAAMENDLNGSYVLTTDITLTQDWYPVGTADNPFTGKLDGAGHIIKGLYFEDEEANNTGLFGYTDGAEVTKLGIEDAYMVGNADVGAIIGNMNGGLVSECYVSDSYISGRDHVGSLVGAACLSATSSENAVVKDSYSTAHVYSRSYQAGGVIGIIKGADVSNCFFSGHVESNSNRVGGIIALIDNDNPGKIENCVNLAAYIINNGTIGRIANFLNETHQTTYTNNYSLAGSRVGTSVLDAAPMSDEEDATSTQGKSLDSDAKALTEDFYKTTLGWDFANIWKQPKEGEMYPILKWQSTPVKSTVYGIPNPARVIWSGDWDDKSSIKMNRLLGAFGEKLSFEIQSGSNYVEFFQGDLYVKETIMEDGVAVIKINQTTATDAVSIVNSTFEVKVVLGTTVYEVDTPEKLLAVNENLAASYRLTADIDMNGESFEGFGSTTEPFTGKFYGNGKAITGVELYASGSNKRGFFNVTNGATIVDLKLDISVYGGNQDIGGLIGSANNTIIERCYVTGTITGADHVGAFIGGNASYTEVTDCYSDAEMITTNCQVGGFFGTVNGGVVANRTYFSGTITAPTTGWTNNAGGYIGLLEGGSDNDIISSAFMGSVTGGTVGYFVARANTGLFLESIENLYLEDASIQAGDGGFNYEDTNGIPGEAATDAELKQKATYVAMGWDFDNVWSIDEGKSYPTLSKPAVATEDVNASKAYQVSAENNTVNINGINNAAMVRIYTANGQLVSQASANGSVTMSLPTAGLYIVTIIENGKTFSTKIINK